MPAIEFTKGPLAGRRLTLAEQTYTLGRHPDRDLPLDDARASGLHAQLEPEDGGWKIVDMKSSNGTSLNSAPVKSARLSAGDVVEIGNSTFIFHENDEAVASSPDGETPEPVITDADELALVEK